MKWLPALAFLGLPTAALSGGLEVSKAMVPLAPPGMMAHAAFMEITNTGDATRRLIGANAKGYAKAHIHLSEEKDGIATMSAVDLVDIAPGQTVVFAHGGLHVMLMRPESALAEGDTVELTLEFANGETVPVAATVMKRHYGH